MLKFLFIIDRQVYYKHLSPIIEEALRRGYFVICLHNYSNGWNRYFGLKSDQFPSLSSCPQFDSGRPVLEIFENASEIVEIIRKNNIDVVISLHGSRHYAPLRKNKNRPVWIEVQHGADNFLSNTCIDSNDLFACYSRRWPEHFKKKRGNIFYVGFPALDSVNYNCATIKNKYRIKNESSVITYFVSDHPGLYSMPKFSVRIWFCYIFSDFYWSRGFDRIYNAISKLFETELSLIRALRAYADAHEAVLIIKSRSKRKISSRIARLADIVLYDESYYPATGYELMKISNLVVSFVSTAHLEAAHFDCQAISVYPTRLRDFFEKYIRYLFPLDLSTSTQAISHFIEKLNKKNIEFVSALKTENILGTNHGRSAVKIVDLALTEHERKNIR
jgi:hypothetical protein